MDEQAGEGVEVDQLIQSDIALQLLGDVLAQHQAIRRLDVAAAVVDPLLEGVDAEATPHLVGVARIHQAVAED